MEKKSRLLYIDNIRLFIISLVVIMHLSVTYSGIGNWYYTEHGDLGFLAGTFFSFFQAFLQSFFMGFLFLLSGYFSPQAYDRKDFSKFVHDRAVRLGLPALLYMFAIDPLTEFFLVKRYTDGLDFFSYYLKNITSGHILTGNGPLWFAIAVLIFSMIYAVIRFYFKDKRRYTMNIEPNVKNLGTLVLIITAFAFLIRIWLPIITSIFNMMLCFFAQYIVLFIVGILAYRYDLFSKLNKRFMRLLYFAPLFGFGGWGALMLACQAFWGSNYALFNGGFTLQSALYSFWESFTAVAMDIGLLVLFREKFNGQNRLIKTLSSSAFAVYVFHTPIIVAIALLFKFVAWSPFLKFLLMIPVCLPICFAISYAFTKIPYLKKIL